MILFLLSVSPSLTSGSVESAPGHEPSLVEPGEGIALLLRLLHMEGRDWRLLVLVENSIQSAAHGVLHSTAKVCPFLLPLRLLVLLIFRLVAGVVLLEGEELLLQGCLALLVLEDVSGLQLSLQLNVHVLLQVREQSVLDLGRQLLRDFLLLLLHLVPLPAQDANLLLLLAQHLLERLHRAQERGSHSSAHLIFDSPYEGRLSHAMQTESVLPPSPPALPPPACAW
mmetsp:Transcript_41552/g.130964  ORF Transcript_41552/g.130964 Transcript_41552/m.130964 type:complete len:226 (+) Transcript_41552:844-1521(+)